MSTRVSNLLLVTTSTMTFSFFSAILSCSSESVTALTLASFLDFFIALRFCRISSLSLAFVSCLKVLRSTILSSSSSFSFSNFLLSSVISFRLVLHATDKLFVSLFKEAVSDFRFLTYNLEFSNLDKSSL